MSGSLKPSTGDMPASRWRHYLRGPKPWLLLFAILGLLLVADTFRSPSSQVTGSCYVGLIHGYQAVGRPLLKGRVQCCYVPSCSDYSIEAVETHGLRSGLVLTWKRLRSCDGRVPSGTPDPVPPER
jgi:putative membrane protein insertion efficiency factor